MSTENRIFHIAQADDWQAALATGRYQCASLLSESFIHCCDRDQLSGVVDRYYQQIDSVMLLSIDTNKLDSPLIRENTVGGAELFPHIYGSIPVDAVVDAVDFGLQSVERQALGE